MEAYRTLRLRGVQRAFYFSLPVFGAVLSALLVYGLCVSLWRLGFGDHSQNNGKILAICAVLLLICLVITAVSYYILKLQLRYTVVHTTRVAQANFSKVLAAVRSDGWIVQEANVTDGIVCLTSYSIRKISIRVTVLFKEHDVLVNSIVDPMTLSTGRIRSQARYIKIVSNAVA